MSEPLKFLSESEALARLDRSRVRQVLRTAFAGLANGASVQPAQTTAVFPGEAGNCKFYPGLISDLDVVGVKVSPFISALKRAGKTPVTAYTLLMSASTGLPLLMCDARALTTCRTAATTALALEYLTPASARTLTVIGSGKLAVEHLRYVAEQHPWRSKRVWSPSLCANPVKGRDFVDGLRAEGINVELAESAESAVSDADVVMLCTSSGTPVIQTGWLHDNAVITSISTNGARAHEIEPSSLPNFHVFCDYRATAPVTAGEMVLAIESGTWASTSIKGDLPELVAHAVARPASGRIFFRSTGLGIEDLAIASLCL